VSQTISYIDKKYLKDIAKRKSCCTLAFATILAIRTEIRKINI